MTDLSGDRSGADVRAALRDAGRAVRAGLSPDHRAAATSMIVEGIAALPELMAARRVLLTRAVGDELDLRPLEHLLAAAGVTICLPVVDGDRLQAVDLVPDAVVRPGWHGVPEPTGTATDGPIDVVVVPALALDRDGGRLGYGGGHFDRFLAPDGPGGAATTIGAVFDVQLVDAVPTRSHDVAVDVVITERGVWRPGRRRGG